MNILKYILLFLSIIILNGCAGAHKELSVEQMKNFKSISIHKPRFSDNAKFEILDNIRTSKVQDTIGPTGGFIPSLIGGLIDSGIHSYNQGKFENKYENKLKKINEYQVTDIDKEIESRILSVIKKDDFLNTKIVNNSSTYFDTYIKSYRLVKKYIDQNDEVYLGTRIDLIVYLKGKDDKYLVDGKYMTIYSKDAYSVTELANNNNLVGKLFNEAYDSLEEKFILYINETFKNKQL